MTELLPCPFCNAQLEHSEALSSRNARRMIHPRNGCVIEGLSLSLSDRVDDGERAEAWNRRTLPPTKKAEGPALQDEGKGETL